MFCRVADVQRRKLDPKARKRILMRVISYGKYRVYLESEKRFTTSRHARIFENEFPARSWSVINTNEEINDSHADHELDVSEESDDSNDEDPLENTTNITDNQSENVLESVSIPSRYPERLRREPRDWWYGKLTRNKFLCLLILFQILFIDD